MVKNILKTLVFFLPIWFLVGFAGAIEIGDKPIDVFKLKTKPFTRAKLVKEWALKELDPKLPLYIVSLTANKYGVYVLVKNVETRTGHRKLSELPAEEKRREIEKMKWSFGRVLTEEEYANEPGYGLKIIQMESYWVQHYTDGGVFVRRWNGEQANQKLNIASKIASDDAGNIFVADYGSNKIKKFSPEGKFLLGWKINFDEKINEDEELKSIKKGGIAVFGNKYLYALSSSNGGLIYGLIYKFNTRGKCLGKIETKIMFWTERDENDYLIHINDRSFKNGEAGYIGISDIAVNEKGELFILGLAEDVICNINENGTVKRWYLAVLNQGFNTDLNPSLWKEITERMETKKYNTSNRGEMGIFDYRPGAISCKGNLIFVNFLGTKPFGILDAMIINSKTGDLAYFIQKRRFNLGEPEGKTDERNFDLAVEVAFHDKHMFLGRTTTVQRGLKEKIYVKEKIYNVVQKHELRED